MRSLTTAIILSLAFDFEADAEVYADMWFGISLRTPLLEDGVFVQCDWPHDGLAELWEYLAHKFPERVSVQRDRSDLQANVANRISAGMMERYEEAQRAYRDHRGGAHPDRACPPCEDCEVLASLSNALRCMLDLEWGSKDVDPAIERAEVE